ncbi:MAG TPA: Cna B-type domain-containing protein, partial [Candidatus Limosilactobacillus intestinigallinarum]|nr:Cna B-type domain-containing protein [Candidatus Limosilactobacillus intestinigallinarum]
MRFRLQCKRAMTVFLALLTVILAFCFMRPVSADQTVTPTSVTTVTNQPNAPNKGNQSTQSIAQASLATGNSQQTNQSTSATASDGANANKSATTAAKSAEDNLSAAKKNAQSTADQPQPTSGSNDSQTMNIRESRTTATPQTLAAEKATQATAGQEIQPTSINATITDASGNEVPAGQTPQVNQYSPLNIHFSFDLTGKNVQPGDYFNFTIGNSGDHLSVQNASIQLYDQNSKHIGYVDLTSASGQINGRVTFTTTGSDANGEFDVQLKVNGNNTSSGTTVPVTITLPNDHKITGEFKYVPGSDAPEEQFSKYSYNSKLGPDKSNPKATDPDYYTPDDITKGNLTYAIRLIHHHGDAEYTKATITDQLQTPGFTYDQKSFLLYKTHWTYTEGDDGSYHWSSGSLHNIPSSDYTLTISADDRSFTMDFDTPTLGDGDGYIIFYRLLYNGEPVNKITNVDDKPADGTVIHNTAELNRPGGKTITYPQTMVISGSDGKAQVKFFTITVTKTDQSNKPLAGATFQLIRNSDKSVVQTKTTGADGKLTFDRLLRDNYTLHELVAPSGYDLAKDVQISSDDFAKTHDYAVTIKDEVVPTTSVKVTKKWDDNNDQDGIRPKSVTVDLLVNGVKDGQSRVLNEDNNWTATFDNLPVSQDGETIEYTVAEETVANSKYTAKVTGDAKSGFTITNTYTPATTSVKVTKSWNDNDNQDGKRPDKVTVILLANGEETKHSIELSKANNWTDSFTNLPVYKDGKKINYTVEEETDDKLANYTSKVTGDATQGFTITNTEKAQPKPEVTSVTVTKSWDDNNNQDGLRPDKVIVDLLVNGSKNGQSKELSKSNNWTATFDNLPVSQDGHAITYTVAEETVANYTPTVTGNAKDGFIITNTHKPATTSVKVTKSWNDNNDQDGLRPKSVTVHLFANGNKTDQYRVLNEGNNWTATFDNLSVNQAGHAITYTVAEDGVANYTSATTGDAKDGFTITNTHKPATTSVKVTKNWDDNNDQDGLRPTSVTVHLFANGNKTDQYRVLNEGNNWTATFDNLLVNQAGHAITYTVEEEAVANYTPTVTGNAKDGFTITNTHTPATTSIKVTKSWDDSNDQDGLRPKSVTVHLMNGDQVVQTKVLNAENHWSATFDQLAVNEDGKPITYTVKEDGVSNYTSTVTGNAKDGFTITNTHTPATTSVKVTKNWDDSDDQDGIRPKSVTVHLMNGDQVVQTKVLNAENHWNVIFDQLAVNENGKPITYTVKEDGVANYTSAVTGDAKDGFTITNTHTPATTNLTVNKVWKDADNQDGLRPTSIKINLLANGQVVKTVDLTAAGNWSGGWTNLPVYQAGKKVTYTVEEADVPAGYQATVNGNTITNTHTPVTISKSVTKQWVDNDNQDGIRPTEITVNLLANGKIVKTLTLSATNNWTATVNGLAQKTKGQDIDYTWQEANVPAGYQAKVDGDTITNTHTPATIAKTVTKQWVDNDNQDGIRPNEITVNLLANGKVVKTLTLNAANNWTATVNGLAQKANGQDIKYTWQEVNVPDCYQATVDGDLITNTHTPATISKSVTKQWVDNDNQDGIRPTEITVNLLANGKVVKTLTLNAANNWTATVNGLAQKANGQDINYTWQEANVPAGYQATVNGNTITNTHTPATITKTVTKQWVDHDNQDGIRPTEITVNLLANGKVVRTLTL